MKKQNSKVFGFEKTGLMCFVLASLMCCFSGCDGEGVELDEMRETCPPKIMQREGYLVCEGSVSIGEDQNGFYFPSPTCFHCDEKGKNIEDKEEKWVKVANEDVNKYIDWNEYLEWITNEGSEYRLTSVDEVETLYHQLRKLGYVKINGVKFDSESGKYKDTFKYGYCPAEASRCGLDNNVFFCEDLLTCRKNEHYDGVSKCVPDRVEKCGSETNNCTKIVGWVEGDCEGGKCVATKCDESNGYSLYKGACNAACMPGQVKCDNKCVDPNSDPNYCGATGTIASCENKGKVCEAGSLCANGQCVVSG